MNRPEDLSGRIARTPLILLVDVHPPGEANALSEWLALHSFSTYEAVDALDAVGLISDFTTERMPDVVTIPREHDDDGTTFSELLCDLVGEEEAEFPVFLFSQEKRYVRTHARTSRTQ